MSLLIVANWKMHGDFPTFFSFIEGLSARLGCLDGDVEVVVCPPFVALSNLVKCVNTANIKFGGQNCCYAKNGKYTGEISAEMLYNCGCSYVIVGHSERRGMFNESDSDIQLKADIAIESGLIPIICIGETLLDRENGILESTLLSQCEKSFPKQHGRFVIAYEPVWAIGSDTIPSTDVIVEALDIIKSYNGLPDIIYGGAVSQNNIRDVMNISKLSGVLVGGASLKLDSFYGVICGAVSVRQSQ